jgi:hypothetical protein
MSEFKRMTLIKVSSGRWQGQTDASLPKKCLKHSSYDALEDALLFKVKLNAA